jgi:hypothetical protein
MRCKERGAFVLDQVNGVTCDTHVHNKKGRIMKRTRRRNDARKAMVVGSALTAICFVLTTQAAPAAIFTFDMTVDMTNTGPDGAGHQQKWSESGNWQYVSGVDDGANGYPDGADTFTIDRTPGPTNNPTRLTTEGSAGSLVSVAGITGTGTNGAEDIVLKSRNFTIGDLTTLATGATGPFHIREERDKSLTINGVIGGDGDLLLSRSGGFSDGVDSDELITITGTAPNTITGSVRLWNSNNSSSEPQPSYWVADKVGAFGQTPTLTLEGRAGANGGIASLQFTANTLGGEGAIDDDATEFYIGAKGVLSMDAGVNEVIGSGNLFIDLSGAGAYTTVADGVYDNSVDWITGDGTVTVGIPEPSSVCLGVFGMVGLLGLTQRRKK